MAQLATEAGITASVGTFDGPVMATKLALPRPPTQFIERRRLMDRLDRGADLPLTLVSAPAGSGKTALMAAWASRRERLRTTAWITLEESDTRPGAFWPVLVECLRRHGADVPGDPTDLVSGVGPGTLSELAATVARLTQPLTLVLDGYENAPAEISSGLDFLLRHSGDRLHLVIITRADPILPLHRYRLTETIAEIRMADLALTEEETSRFVQLSGITLSPDAISALTNRTRGWAAGLRFATMFLRRCERPEQAVLQLAGDSGNIAEYLMAEMLQSQPVKVRAMLLHTSVVDVLRPGLIEELGGPAAGRMLASIARSNVLVEPLVEQPGWYRYHPFLRDLLRAELAYRSPSHWVRLHRKAARWMAQNGLLSAAVELAGTVGDWTLASRFVLDDLAIGQVMMGGDSFGLAQALRRLPADIEDAAASVVRAALALSDGDAETCAEELAATQEALASSEPPRDRSVELAADVVDAALACLVRDPQAVTRADRAEQHLAVQGRGRLAAHPELTALVQASKGLALLREGRLNQARSALTLGARAAEAPGGECLLVGCLGCLALIAALKGELRRSHDVASRSAALAERVGMPADGRLPAAEVARAWVCAEQYRLRAGAGHLKAAMESSALRGDPLLRAMAAIAQARLLRARGDAAGAIHLIEAVREHVPADSGWLAELLQIEAATLTIALGQPDDAVQMADDHREADGVLVPAARSLMLGTAHVALGQWTAVEESVSDILTRTNGDRPALPTVVAGRLLQVAHALQTGQAGRARVALARCLHMAEPEGLRRPFLEAPGVVREMLEADHELAVQSSWLGSPDGSQGRRAAVAHRSISTGGSSEASQLDPITEPLTAKETEVLGHLSALLSTEEIAAAMFVSVNTVRTHVRSILRKLAVTRRNDAVRRARAVGLIS